MSEAWAIAIFTALVGVFGAVLGAVIQRKPHVDPDLRIRLDEISSKIEKQQRKVVEHDEEKEEEPEEEFSWLAKLIAFGLLGMFGFLLLLRVLGGPA